MNRNRPTAMLLLALLAGASWLFCIGPCALGPFEQLGGMQTGNCESGGCAPCGDESQPSEPGGGSRECLAQCQSLRFAIAPTPAVAPAWALEFIECVAFAEPTRLSPVSVASCRRAVDTGPPFARSFAELVLQESLLSHAPPRTA
jgi:hypothetical protein